MIDNPTLEWVRQHNAKRITDGLRRVPRIRTSSDSLLDLASNDYLGLARDERVIAAAADAARTA